MAPALGLAETAPSRVGGIGNDPDAALLAACARYHAAADLVDRREAVVSTLPATATMAEEEPHWSAMEAAIDERAAALQAVTLLPARLCRAG